MKEIEKRLFGRKIYALKFPSDTKSHSFVMNVEYWTDPPKENIPEVTRICYLNPPDRGHSIKGTIIKEHEWGFTFCSTGYESGEWVFTEITLDSFIEVYHNTVIGGLEICKDMKSTKELQDWFYNKFM